MQLVAQIAAGLVQPAVGCLQTAVAAVAVGSNCSMDSTVVALVLQAWELPVVVASMKQNKLVQ